MRVLVIEDNADIVRVGDLIFNTATYKVERLASIR
jgi:hypothetical protein